MRYPKPGICLLLFLFVAALLYLRFPEYIANPGGFIEPYGDGLKTYTIPEYHARYDSTLSWYEGMNYPYGEHITTADGHPIVANVLQALRTTFPSLVDYNNVLINYGMFLGVALGVFFLFLIFTKLGLPWWWAIPFSGAVIFLSPQIARMGAHYGLGHVEVVPGLIFLLWSYHDKPNIQRSLLIGLWIFICSLWHFYFFALTVFAVSFYFLIDFLAKKDWQKLPQLAAHYSLQVLLPFAFFFYWLIWSDPIDDRCQRPWGFFELKAKFQGLFTSLDQPFWQMIEKRFGVQDVGFEAAQYVGMTATIVLIALLLRWLLSLFKKPLFHFEKDTTGFWPPFAAATFALLLFAFAYPFRISGLEGLLDYTGPVRHFRSLARFGWVFYYTLNIVVIVFLYEWLGKTRYGPVLMGLALLLNSYEAWQFNKRINLKPNLIKRMEAGHTFYDIADIDYDSFQALVCVPTYHLGSDLFWWTPEGFLQQNSLVLGLQTGMPTTSASLPRTGRRHTLNQLQLVTPPYRLPAIFADFPNQKDLLMMVDTKRYAEDSLTYRHLLNKEQLLFDDEKRMQLYRLPLSSFKQRIQDTIQSIQTALDTMLSDDNSGFLFPDSTMTFYYESFDTQQARQHYLGNGGMNCTSEQWNQLDIHPDKPFQADSTAYVLSFWVYLDEDKFSQARFVWEEVQADGTIYRHTERSCREQTILFDSNGWGLIEYIFYPQKENSQWRMHIRNTAAATEHFYIDELLVYPKAAAIYKKTKTYIWKNNRHYLTG